MVRKSSAPAFQAAHAVGRLVERRDHHDGNVGRPRVGFQPLADFETIHFRHHDVEQDHIHLGAITDIERIAAVARGQNVEILRHQPRFEQLHVGGNIVDDQNARSHVRLPSRIPEIGLDGLDEFRDRNRLGDIGLATALTDSLFVALHRKGGHGDHRDYMQFRSSFSHLVTSRPDTSGNWISIRIRSGR